MATNNSANLMEIDREAADQVEAAVSEAQRGDIPFSVGLLIEASQKELLSLSAMERTLDLLRESIDQRRRAIDQQEQMLRDLASSLG